MMHYLGTFYLELWNVLFTPPLILMFHGLHVPPSRWTPNPFFGYPATEAAADGSTSAPTLRHGRRRKRDLLRTLLRLWWSRWRYHIKALLLLMILVLALWARRNRVRHR